ncbi:hypothetical protein [Metallosphaera hakonensis]|uniref:hypothetical protein n=1 Tax=Metallosphaera hakonensis TaxID=79601 RepID=UPI0014430A20|nr:hypothetical protein [Metallosphaera hakonensis]
MDFPKGSKMLHRMCGFPHIHERVWVGVTPLKGRRRMNGAMPLDFGEVQGLRIG